MMIQTKVGVPMDTTVMNNYFGRLVDMFFKILPMWEQCEANNSTGTKRAELQTYISSLQLELIGCRDFVCPIRDNPDFITLISILQYFVDHPTCDSKSVKREVFRSIRICNRLKDAYLNSCEVVT